MKVLYLYVGAVSQATGLVSVQVQLPTIQHLDLGMSYLTIICLSVYLFNRLNYRSSVCLHRMGQKMGGV